MACETCLKIRERAYALLAGGTRQVALERDFTYALGAGIHIQYVAGTTYMRVPDAAAQAIVTAGAGTIDD